MMDELLSESDLNRRRPSSRKRSNGNGKLPYLHRSSQASKLPRDDECLPPRAPCLVYGSRMFSLFFLPRAVTVCCDLLFHKIAAATLTAGRLHWP